MTYTQSADGAKRANIKVEFRLTKLQITVLKEYAKMKRAGVEGWKDMLYFHGINWTEYLPSPSESEELSKAYIAAWKEFSGIGK